MSRRLLPLTATHGLAAAAMLALGWEAARLQASLASRRNGATATGPVRPSKPVFTAAAPSASDSKTVPAIGPEDPAAFVAWAKTIDRRYTNDLNDPACAQLKQTFKGDRARALEIALLARQENCPQLFKVFAIEWTKTDFAGALAWARHLDPEVSAAAMEALPSGITPENAADAAHSFLPELAEGKLRNQTMQAIYSGWSEGDPVACLTWLRSLPVPDALRLLDEGYASTLTELVRADPAGASKFVRGLPQNGHSSELLQDTARGLAEIDPLTALEWAGSLDSSAARALCLDSVWRGWSGHDLDAATKAALAQTDPTMRRQVIEVLADCVFRRRSAEVQSWMNSLPADLGGFAQARIVSVTISEAEPNSGAAELSRLLAGSETRDETLPLHALALGGRLAREDPEEASGWAAALAPGSEQREAARGVASAWAWADPVATRAWVESLTPGTARDGAAAGLAGELAGLDPETAFGLAASVGSAGERAAAFNTVLDEWKHSDPTAARQCIEASALDPAEKSALIGRLSLPKRQDNKIIW